MAMIVLRLTDPRLCRDSVFEPGPQRRLTSRTARSHPERRILATCSVVRLDALPASRSSLLRHVMVAS